MPAELQQRPRNDHMGIPLMAIAVALAYKSLGRDA
jgi:hypothetical protein